MVETKLRKLVSDCSGGFKEIIRRLELLNRFGWRLSVEKVRLRFGRDRRLEKLKFFFFFH